MSQITLNVPDISCAHCEKTVLSTLQGKPGVNSVQVSIPTKKVLLDYDESTLDLEQAKADLDEEGYPVAGIEQGFTVQLPKGGFIPLTGK
jgi:copper chaperone